AVVVVIQSADGRLVPREVLVGGPGRIANLIVEDRVIEHDPGDAAAREGTNAIVEKSADGPAAPGGNPVISDGRIAGSDDPKLIAANEYGCLILKFGSEAEQRGGRREELENAGGLERGRRVVGDDGRAVFGILNQNGNLGTSTGLGEQALDPVPGVRELSP